MKGLAYCRKHRLITGVATSVCKSNIDDLATETFINELVNQRVHFLWYYIYRPVGPKPSPELSLSSDEIIRLRQFIVNIRAKAPIMVVDSYWDHEGRALCPAATGIGYHIGPGGDVEPCPPIQFAGDNIHDNGSIYDVLTQSKFLTQFRNLARCTTRGCIIMERPDLLENTVRQNGIWDSSGRGTGLEELCRMTPRSSHHIPDKEIPEKYWPYRLAKKYWFFGFGAYG